MARKKVLVVGGTGHFGRLLMEDLRRYTDCDLVVGNRSVAELWNPVLLDAALSGVVVAICAAGPFQSLPTTLPELCLRRAIHYIDLADDRDFVRRVRDLVPHEDNDLPGVCPGWSTVSALSGLLAQIGAAGLGNIDAIHIHMAPGKSPPERARYGCIASSFSRSAIQCLSQWAVADGQSMVGRNHAIFLFPPPIGRRCGYLVDVPDHELFPQLFDARTVEFRTASELRILNLATSFLGWCVRKGVVRSWSPWSRHAPTCGGNSRVQRPRLGSCWC